VTGVREGEFKPEVYEFLAEVKKYSRVPVAVGFGISSAGQIEKLRNHCDGVIVGSAIVREISNLENELRNRDSRSQALERLKEYLLSLTGRTMTI
jgi:tryptophan synthase alpha chain